MKVYLPYFQLTQAITNYVDPALRAGDLDTCIDWTNRMLGKVPRSAFHAVRDLDFTTCPDDTAGKFDEWTLSQESVRPFGSAYTETNGFAHNTWEWHFHWFAYEADGVEGDYDYLGEGYLSQDYDGIVLTGMEPVQAAFRKKRIFTEGYMAGEDLAEDDFARDICECQVVFKFMRFIQQVTGKMKQFRHPLVVSSHDWDTFLRIIPGEDLAKESAS